MYINIHHFYHKLVYIREQELQKVLFSEALFFFVI